MVEREKEMKIEIQKIDFLENEKSFLGEIKKHFPYFFKEYCFVKKKRKM